MNFINIENEIREYWNKNHVYEKAVEQNKGKKVFTYLDGPPYTNGDIHLGHAWGKALRDSLLRYKRMQGFEVYDRPGFDMHGLPIEVEVEKKMGLKSKKDIEEKLGTEQFINTCKEFAIKKMTPMIEQFKFMGVWMNWKNPYLTISKEYIENLWYILKKAHEKKLLYKDKTAMTWCPRCETALAKHELEYKTLTDNSIYVKLPVRDKEREYLIIWTTTPWTVPFNLAVMVHPNFEYVKAKVKTENGIEKWIIAEAMSANVINTIAGYEFEIIEKFKGKQLKDIKYYPPFYEWNKVKENEKYDAFKIVLTDKYVDLSSGSGLVHCAPGCGAEDNEVGKENGLPAFNLVDEQGKFPKEFGDYTAKTDDKKFIEMIKEKGLLVATVPIKHEYATCWRCKTPIIFRSTTQWYLSVSPLKDLALNENEKVKWIPEWGGEKAFKAWLENLQDWCISRQRYWGTPLPIWTCKNGHIHVIGSAKELEELSNVKITDLHKHELDKITFKCPECGEEMHRIPDVIDVWLDSGSAPWSVLDYVNDNENFKKHFPVDFVLEGKDQIRGWFNSLMNMSIITEGKAPYKAVYMTGMINDAQGRKMSKSLKNFIYPNEVFDKYGVDVFRYYTIGGTEAGENLNYNFKDINTKSRNLLVYWNIHKLLMTMEQQNNIDLTTNNQWIKNNYNKLSIEAKYIINTVNKAIKETTNLFDNYLMHKVPNIIEKTYIELSKTYIQSIRDKATYGNNYEKEEIIRVIAYSIDKINLLLSPITPFISEKIFMNLKQIMGYHELSIHLKKWPVQDFEIDKKLMSDFNRAMEIITKIQKIRDRIKRGVRWPIKEVIIENITIDEKLIRIIKSMTNVKKISLKTIDEKCEIEEYQNGKIGVVTEMNEELITEGYAREIMRRIQAERKKQGLEKVDKILLHINSEINLGKYYNEIKIRTGAKEIVDDSFENKKEFTIKNKKFEISFKKI